MNQAVDLDLAKISANIYGDGKFAVPSGFTKLSLDQVKARGLWNLVLSDPLSGLRSAVYFAEEGTYVYAFAGSRDVLGPDAATDGSQALGLETRQYDLAIENAKILAKIVGADNLQLTGHSLGGGLASVGALAAGSKAATFDAAGIHPHTLSRAGLSADRAKDLISAYYLKGEVLSSVQDLGFHLLPQALGTRIGLSPPPKKLWDRLNPFYALELHIHLQLIIDAVDAYLQ